MAIKHKIVALILIFITCFIIFFHCGFLGMTYLELLELKKSCAGLINHVICDLNTGSQIQLKVEVNTIIEDYVLFFSFVTSLSVLFSTLVLYLIYDGKQNSKDF